MRPRRQHGFTLVELLVAMSLTCAVMACVLLMAAAAQDVFAVQPESADVQQRMRVTASLLMKDLMMAGAGRSAEDVCEEAMGAPVLPYRVGQEGSDAAAGRYYRPGTISVVYSGAAPAGAAAETLRRTYYLAATPPDSSQLMQYDGLVTDRPVLEHVVMLRFELFGVPPGFPVSAAADAVLLDPATFGDGPWCPDAADPDRFDEDLLRIRRVRVHLRVQAPRQFRGPAGDLFAYRGTARRAWVPDQVVRFDVAPRNLEPAR